MDYDMVPFELSSHCRTLTQRHISSELRPKVHCICVFVCVWWRQVSDSDKAVRSNCEQCLFVGCWIRVAFKSHHRPEIYSSTEVHYGSKFWKQY